MGFRCSKLLSGEESGKRGNNDTRFSLPPHQNNRNPIGMVAPLELKGEPCPRQHGSEILSTPGPLTQDNQTRQHSPRTRLYRTQPQCGTEKRRIRFVCLTRLITAADKIRVSSPYLFSSRFNLSTQQEKRQAFQPEQCLNTAAHNINASFSLSRFLLIALPYQSARPMSMDLRPGFQTPV